MRKSAPSFTSDFLTSEELSRSGRLCLSFTRKKVATHDITFKAFVRGRWLRCGVTWDGFAIFPNGEIDKEAPVFAEFQGVVYRV